MTNTTAIMTAAWTIARQGAAKFGGRVSAYLSASLKAAWAAAKAPKPVTLDGMASKVREMAGVYSASIWNGRRLYVNLTGFNRSFAGDRNLKVFWTPASGWTVEGVKGNMSTTMARSLTAFGDAMGIRCTWLRA